MPTSQQHRTVSALTYACCKRYIVWYPPTLAACSAGLAPPPPSPVPEDTPLTFNVQLPNLDVAAFQVCVCSYEPDGRGGCNPKGAIMSGYNQHRWCLARFIHVYTLGLADMVQLRLVLCATA